MEVTPIKTRRDYRRALKTNAKRGTRESDYFDVLVTLVEAWERQHYPIDFADSIDAIKCHMDQNGLWSRDLVPFIGSRNVVDDVLNRRRSLTLTIPPIA
jgi:HTH-type transcriptional regulator / antitoxin HigA